MPRARNGAYIYQRFDIESLQHADELVADRRDDDAERLGQHDQPGQTPVAQPEGGRSFGLTGRDQARIEVDRR